MQFRPRIMKRKNDQRGQALIEFALCMPVVALILMGILEFGFLMFTKNDVTEAARDGARLAAVNGGGGNTLSCAATSTWYGAACQSAPSGADICIKSLDGNLDTGAAIEVKVTYVHNWFTGLGQIVNGGNPITLTGRTVMRLERQGTNLPSGAATGGVCATTP